MTVRMTSASGREVPTIATPASNPRSSRSATAADQIDGQLDVDPLLTRRAEFVVECPGDYIDELRIGGATPRTDVGWRYTSGHLSLGLLSRCRSAAEPARRRSHPDAYA